jgi:hypothetical protein
MFTAPDVSEHQGNVDWKKVATKHELAIVRVADGRRYCDERGSRVRW